MNRPTRRQAYIAALILLAVPFALSPAMFAQSPATRYLAPAKDAAMLVDVSVSVRDDRSGHRDAKQIIKDLLSGKGFSASNFDRWEIEPGDPSMRNLFARFLGDQAETESAELAPLMAHGRSFLSLHIGRLSTVLNEEVSRSIRDVTGIGELVEMGYPTRMEDKSTCFWYGMAQAAETLSQKSRDGYYLFVVSDEEDDPDYLPDGPPGHSKSDYAIYSKGLINTMPVSVIRASIERFFERKPNSARNAEQYTPKDRSKFQQVLIAKFIQRGARTSANKVRISWYGMGVAPVRETVKPPPPPPPPGVPPPLAYIAPKLTPRPQLLGGWQWGRDKERPYRYEQPYVVWQVQNLEAAAWELSQQPRVKLEGKGGGSALKDSPRRIKAWQLPKGVTGSHKLAMAFSGDSTAASNEQSIEPLTVEVVILPKTDFWLNALALVSAAAAAGIFFFAWRNLRENRVVAMH